jgi:hypothetical protein
MFPVLPRSGRLLLESGAVMKLFSQISICTVAKPLAKFGEVRVSLSYVDYFLNCCVCYDLPQQFLWFVFTLLRFVVSARHHR